jgi:hypothetical protein
VVSYKERKQRFFNELTNLDQLYTILKTKFHGKTFRIKYDVEMRDAQLNEFKDSEKEILVVTSEEYRPGSDNVMIISGLLEKYFEVELYVIETLSPGYFKTRIQGGRVATTGRSDIRFKVKEGDVVATNFRFSKYSIDVNSLTLPTSIKVILDQFENSKRATADVYEVGYFSTDDPILAAIKKTSDMVWIEDLANPDTFKPPIEHVLDLKNILEEKFDSYIIKLKERGFKSIMIIPIIYLTETEQTIPLAYIRVISKTKNFGMEDVFSIKEETFKLIDRIREANTVMMSERQRIADISRGGVKLLINHDDLKRYLIKSRGFIFDIVFRLQQPITIYGEIKFTGSDEEKNIILGISFAGNTSRKDQMKHLYAILEPMEVEYKKKLIMQRKAQTGAAPTRISGS